VPLPPCWTTPPPLPDPELAARARQQQAQLTKPPGSLGLLEELAVCLAAQQGSMTPSTERVQITVFAADHGVCREGVSAFPQSVTAQMIANFASGGAAISVLARQLEARLEVVNLGTVEATTDLPGVLNQPIAPGTANLACEPAMTPAQLQSALQSGDEAAARAADQGCDLFIGGDMGIGNTTTAAAMACVLLDSDPETLAGPGTGLSASGVRHKTDILRLALQRHGPGNDPWDVLLSLGGFEIAALTGAMLGCAQRRIPVLVDGFIVSVAALAGVRRQPQLRHWLHFGHRSAEPGHDRILQALDARPLLDLEMRLGEGSGAAIAVSLLRQACALHNGMASFASAGVDDGQSHLD